MAITPPILKKIVADFASLWAYFMTEIRAFSILMAGSDLHELTRTVATAHVLLAGRICH